MRHDEVVLLVDQPHAFAVEPHGRLLVEHMENRAARAVGQSAHAGYVVHLVDHHRVGDVGLHAGHGRDVGRQQSAQIRGVLARGVAQVVTHGVVDLVDSGRNGLHEPAAADDHRQFADVKVLFAQRREDDFTAPVELRNDVVEAGNLLGRVAERQLQQRMLVVVEGDLGRGGARVDG